MRDNELDAYITSHAERRGAQRNIPDRLQELVLKYANRRNYRPGGLKIALITRKRLDRLTDTFSHDMRERLEGVHVLYDPATNTIVTAFRETDDRARRYRRT